MFRGDQRHWGQSAFNGTDGNTLYEVFLQEGIEHQNRDSGYDNGRRPDNFTGEVCQRFAVSHRNTGGVHGHAGQSDQVVQVLLQGFQRGIGDVHNAGEVAVPVTDAVEQGNGCQHRHGHGEHDPEQSNQVGSTVDAGGFFNRFRQGFVVVLHDEQVEHRESTGEDQSPNRIGQMQAAVQDVVGNHTGSEQHDEDEDAKEELPSPQAGFRQRISGQHRQEHGEKGADDGNEYGDLKGIQKVRLADNIFDGIELKPLGNQVNLSGDDVALGTERLCHHVQAGVKGDDAKQRQDDDVNNREDLDSFFLRDIRRFFHCICCHG